MSKDSPLEHEVVIARSGEDRQKCFDIRFEVFHKEQKFPADVEIDEYDQGDKATHFLLRLTPSLTPVGTVRCVKFAPFTFKLTRLAVLKNYRKHKFGRYLVSTLHDWVQQQAQLDLIHITDHRIISPSSSANDSDQVSANIITSSSSNPVAGTTSDDHSDQISESMLRKPLSSAKIVIHSQIPVQGFYARFGYQPEGEQFDEDGEPHQKMVLRLPLGQVPHVK